MKQIKKIEFRVNEIETINEKLESIEENKMGSSFKIKQC